MSCTPRVDRQIHRNKKLKMKAGGLESRKSSGWRNLVFNEFMIFKMNSVSIKRQVGYYSSTDLVDYFSLLSIFKPDPMSRKRYLAILNFHLEKGGCCQCSGVNNCFSEESKGCTCMYMTKLPKCMGTRELMCKEYETLPGVKWSYYGRLKSINEQLQNDWKKLKHTYLPSKVKDIKRIYFIDDGGMEISSNYIVPPMTISVVVRVGPNGPVEDDDRLPVVISRVALGNFLEVIPPHIYTITGINCSCHKACAYHGVYFGENGIDIVIDEENCDMHCHLKQGQTIVPTVFPFAHIGAIVAGDYDPSKSPFHWHFHHSGFVGIRGSRTYVAPVVEVVNTVCGPRGVARLYWKESNDGVLSDVKSALFLPDPHYMPQMKGLYYGYESLLRSVMRDREFVADKLECSHSYEGIITRLLQLKKESCVGLMYVPRMMSVEYFNALSRFYIILREIDKIMLVTPPSVEDIEVEAQMFDVPKIQQKPITRQEKMFENSSRSPIFEIKLMDDVNCSLNQIRRMKVLFQYVCEGAFDIKILRDAFANFMEVLYTLQWLRKFPEHLKQTACHHLEKAIFLGRTLPRFLGNEFGKSEYTTTYAMREWLSHFKLCAKAFCSPKIFSSHFYVLMEYFKLWTRKRWHEFESPKPRKKEKIEQKPVSYSVKLGRDRRMRKGDVKAEAQMFGSWREALEETKKDMVTDVCAEFGNYVKSAISDFVTNWPTHLGNALDSLVNTLDSDFINTIVDYLKSGFERVRSVIEGVWKNLTGDSNAKNIVLILTLIIFFLSFYLLNKTLKITWKIMEIALAMALQRMGFTVSVSVMNHLSRLGDEEVEAQTGLGGTLLSLIAFLTVSVMDPRWGGTISSFINVASRGGPLVDTFCDQFVDVVDKVYFMYTSRNGEPGEHLFKSKQETEEFDKYFEELQEFARESDIESKVLTDPIYTTKLADLIQRGANLKYAMSMLKSPLTVQYIKVYEALQMLNGRALANADMYKKRIESVVVWLTGQPGQGKSVMLKALPEVLHKMLREEFPGEYPEWSPSLNYERTKNSDYWEGYAGQPYCTKNEILAQRDPIKSAAELLEILNIAEDNVFPLNMAFGEKGKAFFRSEVFLTTTNIDNDMLIKPTCNFGLNNPSAIIRRQTFPFSVIRKDTMRVVDKRIVNPDEAWTFRVYLSGSSVQKEFFLGLSRFLEISPATSDFPKGRYYETFMKQKFFDFSYSEVVSAIFKEICWRKRKNYVGTVGSMLPVPDIRMQGDMSWKTGVKSDLSISMSDVEAQMFSSWRALREPETISEGMKTTRDLLQGKVPHAIEFGLYNPKFHSAVLSSYSYDENPIDMCQVSNDASYRLLIRKSNFREEMEQQRSWNGEFDTSHRGDGVRVYADDLIRRVLAYGDFQDIKSLFRAQYMKEKDPSKVDFIAPIYKKYGCSDPGASDRFYSHCETTGLVYYQEGESRHYQSIMFSVLYLSGNNDELGGVLIHKLLRMQHIGSRKTNIFVMIQTQLDKLKRLRGLEVPREMDLDPIGSLRYLKMKLVEYMDLCVSTFRSLPQYKWLLLGGLAVGVVGTIIAVTIGRQFEGTTVSVEEWEAECQGRSRTDRAEILKRKGRMGVSAQSDTRSYKNPYKPHDYTPGVSAQSDTYRNPYRPSDHKPSVSSQGGFQDALGRTSQISGSIRMFRLIYSSGSETLAYGICSGDKMFTAAHVVRSKGENFSRVEFLGVGGKPTLSLGRSSIALSFKDTIVGMARDLVVFHFRASDGYSVAKDLSKFVQWCNDYAPPVKVGRIHPMDGNSTRMLYTSETITIGEARLSARYETDRGTERLYSNQYYTVQNMPGEKGFCGLPYISTFMGSGVQYLAGLHIAGGNMDSFFVPLYKEDFRLRYDWDGEHWAEVQDRDEEAQCGLYPTGVYISPIIESAIEVGALSHDQCPEGSFPYGVFSKKMHIPSKSELVPSLFQGNGDIEPLFDIKKAPALLGPCYVGGVLREPLRQAERKVFSADKSRPIDDWLLNYQRELPGSLSEGFFGKPEWMKNRSLRRLALKEVCFSGVLDSIDLTTSEGVFLRMHGLKRKDVIRFPSEDEPEGFIHEILYEEIDRIVEAVRRGELPKLVVIGCLKDELREISRVNEGKTRLFCVGDFVHMLWTRMVLGDLIRELKEHLFSTTGAIGTNPHGPDWSSLYREMMKFEGMFGGGDYGLYDSSLRLWFAYCMAIDCANAYGYSHDSFEYREVLYCCISACAPLMILGSKVYWFDFMNPSGGYMTGFFNTYCNNVIFKILWLCEQERCSKECQCGFHLAKFSEDLWKKFYGDDNLWKIRKKFAKHWNMPFLSHEITRMFGMTYTLASKEEVGETMFCSFEDLEFLKRKWRVENPGTIGSIVTAPLDPISIESMLLWVRDTGTIHGNVLQLEQNISVASMEMSYYGKAAWESWSSKIQEACRRFNVKFTGGTFAFQRERFLQTLL